MPESSTTFHAGLTPDHVVDAALALTRESHLAGWSIRDLARRLDVAPSVVYHHVGGKDLIARRVVERALADLTVPDPDLDWADWFQDLLAALHPVVADCPGAAKWLLMHGPTFPSMMPVVEAGIAALLRAGFGDRVGFAYSALLNNALLTISIGDDRLVHEDDGPRDHASMMTEFERAAAGSPGVALLASAFIDPFTRGGGIADRQRRDYYDFVVTTTIAGLTALPRG